MRIIHKNIKNLLTLQQSQFIIFTFVGGLGAIIHFFVLYMLSQKIGAKFIISQGIATYTAMSFNFFLNNSLTFKKNKLTGIKKIKGLLNFNILCSIGAIINLIIAQSFYLVNDNWFTSGLIGAISGSIYNYKMTSIYTWKIN